MMFSVLYKLFDHSCKDNRFVIFDVGKREGKYWGEKEAKFDLACLSCPEAYIFFIEQQLYNYSK